jgi:HTH-type transcriptional regulator/antitoxin HigA
MKMDIRPIRDEADYDWALKEIEHYFEREPDPGTPEADRFDVLATLIAAYEDREWSIPSPDPVDMIIAVMEQRGFTQAELAKIIGSRSRASEILNRKRAITMSMAYKLHAAWHIPAEVLIQPYHIAA